MKKLYFFLAAGIALVVLVAANRSSKNPYGFSKGTPVIKSISALSFGPDGIIFIGDSKSATIFAVDTKDNSPVEKAASFEIKNIDQKIAAALGTEAKNIRIIDIAVNPVSKKIYCAVQGLDGTPVLLTVDKDKVQAVTLKDVLFSSASISNAPAEDQKDRNGRALRDGTISDLEFADGSVMVSGISNAEFASTFRKINFPFTDKQDHATLEIFHAAHGRYETNAPIRTFTVAEFSGKKYIVASYTCTPLVLFPLDELKAGKHVKGRTVAEMGSGNSPIDIITVKKGDASYLLMNNTNRPVMKVKYKSIESYQGQLTEPITESFATGGVDFVNLPTVNVLQMDRFDGAQLLVLQRRPNGDLDLYVMSDRVI